MLDIAFNKDMNASQRRSSISSMQGWVDSNASRSKKIILGLVIKYAEDRLLDQPVGKSSERLKRCESIFKQADLEDIFFLQHVINELNLIKKEDCALKESILPTAIRFKRAFMRPLNHQILGGAFVLGCLSAVLDNRLLVFAVALILLRQHIIEFRIKQRLEEIYAIQITEGTVPVLGDGWDATFTQGGKLGARGAIAAVNTGFGMFKEKVLPKLEEPLASAESKTQVTQIIPQKKI